MKENVMIVVYFPFLCLIAFYESRFYLLQYLV